MAEERHERHHRWTPRKERFLATIEPWHGNEVVVYREREGKWQREVIDDTILDGHNIETADFDGDGQDEIVAGFRGKPYGIYLYPSDDAEAYRQHLAAYENEYKPAGLRECELVQSLADIQWRLQRIPGLEMAIYARGREEFAEQFEDFDPAGRSARIDLETFIHYQKPLRNLQLQEGRLRREREKDMAELRELQQERRQPDQDRAALAKITTPAGTPDIAFLESLYAKATAPKPDPSAIAVLRQFGFEISNPSGAGF